MVARALTPIAQLRSFTNGTAGVCCPPLRLLGLSELRCPLLHHDALTCLVAELLCWFAAELAAALRRWRCCFKVHLSSASRHWRVYSAADKITLTNFCKCMAIGGGWLHQLR